MLIFIAAELGDYEEDADDENVVNKLTLFPVDAAGHMDEIMQEYRTLRSVILYLCIMSINFNTDFNDFEKIIIINSTLKFIVTSYRPNRSRV